MRAILFLTILFISTYCSAQQSPEALLKQMAETFKQHQSLSYTADFAIKYADSKDTSYTQATVHMLRDARDTVWGGMVWIGEGAKFETYAFYDLDKRYVVMNQIGKVWKERPRKNDMGLSIVYRYMIFQPFLQPQLVEQMYTGYEASLLNETTVNGKPCHVVKLSKQQSGTNALTSRTYYLNKEDHFPLMITEETPVNGKYQYSIFTFTSYSFDKAGREQFSPKQIPISYKVDSRDRELPKGAQPQVRPRGEWPLPGNRR